MTKRLGLLAAWVLLGTGLAWAEPDPIRVLAVVGTAEIDLSSRGRWTPLSLTGHPATGDRIRTGAKSRVDFAMDRNLSGMARVGENSLVSIEGPAYWHLDRGQVWLLWEYDNDGAGFFCVASAEGEAKIQGGGFVRADGDGTEVHSFGGVLFSPDGSRQTWELEEGYGETFSARSSGAGHRLTYSDYQDWKAWMTEAYRLKDDRLALPSP